MLGLFIIVIIIAVAGIIIRTQNPTVRGSVAVRVQYLDGYPKSGVIVRKIYPEPIVVLGTTNESGLITCYGLLSGPQNYVVDAWYGGNAVLSVDGNGDGIVTIRANFEITPPTIEVLSPQAQTYTNSSIPLTCSVRDHSAISWAGYSIDEQTNTTITGDAVLKNLSVGRHSLAVYSNDTFGNMGSSQIIYFNVQATWQASQLGIGSDFAGTVAVVDDINYTVTDLPSSLDWVNGSTHTFAFQSPLTVTANAKRYVYINTSGLSTSQNGSITVSSPGSVVANYATQYYLTVYSAYGTVSGTGWYDDTTTAHASLSTAIVDHGNGTRLVFTGWGGDAHGLDYAQSSNMRMNESKSAIAYWKTQYYLMVNADPPGIAYVQGEGWYDSSATVSLTAPPVTNHQFGYWSVDGLPQTTGQTAITVSMDTAHMAKAHYSAESISHDIAVSNVTTSKSGSSSLPTIGEGYTVTINVTVWNEGNSTETFNVTVYANTTVLRAFIEITLAPGDYTSLTLSWNTTGFVKGNYKLGIHAWPVQNETDTGDNTHYSWVIVTIPGDINGDFSVDLYDALLLSGALNSNPNSLYWNPNADINGDVVVDVYDALILASSYRSEAWS